MLSLFKKETAPLTSYEKTVLLPIMTKCLSKRVGKETAITNDEICERMSERGYKVGPARIRKIINHIRIHNLLPCLMATSCGYYVTTDKSEIQEYIETLQGRIDAIEAVLNAMNEQMDAMDRKSPLTCC